MEKVNNYVSVSSLYVTKKYDSKFHTTCDYDEAGFFWFSSNRKIKIDPKTTEMVYKVKRIKRTIILAVGVSLYKSPLYDQEKNQV